MLEFLKRKLTKGRLYDIVDQGAYDLPLAIRSRRYPGFYVDETVPWNVEMNYWKDGILLAFQISDEAEEPITVGEFLGMLEDEGSSWDTPISYLSLYRAEGDYPFDYINCLPPRWDALIPDGQDPALFWTSDDVNHTEDVKAWDGPWAKVISV